MNWLDSLKVGDEVIVPYGWNESRCERITKSTATQIHIGTTKYSRRSGRQIGTDTYSRAFIRQATPEMIAKVKEQIMRSKIQNIKFEKLPIDIIRQVLALLEPHPETSSPDRQQVQHTQSQTE
jgi:hypothetical protein